MAEPAEQRFDHGLIAKEVVPLIILEIGGDDRGVAITQIEILVLRQRRTNKSPRHRSADRLRWVFISRVWAQWRSALVAVKPETVPPGSSFW